MYIAYYNPALLDWDGYQLPHIQRPSTGFSSCVDVRLATSHLLSWLSIQYACGVAWRQCTHPERWWFGKCPSFHIWQFWVSLLDCRGVNYVQLLTMLHRNCSSSKSWICIISELLGLDLVEKNQMIRVPGHGNNPITYLDETFWMEIVPFLETQWPRWLPLVASQRGLKRSTNKKGRRRREKEN